jgi:hypothetical protein
MESRVHGSAVEARGRISPSPDDLSLGLLRQSALCLTALKDAMLAKWIAEKKRELLLFQQAALRRLSGQILARLHLDERMGDLRSRFTYECSANGQSYETVPFTDPRDH